MLVTFRLRNNKIIMSGRILYINITALPGVDMLNLRLKYKITDARTT